MGKFLTLIVGFIWLFAQGASAEPREHDGDHGGIRSTGEGAHAQGLNGGERSYHQPGNHPASGFNRGVSSSRQFNNRGIHQQTSINRARAQRLQPGSLFLCPLFLGGGSRTL